MWPEDICWNKCTWSVVSSILIIFPTVILCHNWVAKKCYHNLKSMLLKKWNELENSTNLQVELQSLVPSIWVAKSTSVDSRWENLNFLILSISWFTSLVSSVKEFLRKDKLLFIRSSDSVLLTNGKESHMKTEPLSQAVSQ